MDKPSATLQTSGAGSQRQLIHLRHLSDTDARRICYHGQRERLETRMPNVFRTPRPRVFIAAVMLASLAQALSAGARAEVLITGDSDAIKVEAKGASVEELLAALQKAYSLQFRSSADLSRSVSGTFAGSLQQVVSRVLSLKGYNFIAETSEEGTMVAVYDMSTSPQANAVMAPRTSSMPPQAAAAMPAPFPPGGRPGQRRDPGETVRRLHQF